MTQYTDLGLGWLDRCLSRALEDEELQLQFSSVSDSLGPLVRGNYDSHLKQSAVLSLLGPAFVYKHFRQDQAAMRIMKSLEKSQNLDMPNETERFSAMFNKVQYDLENMGRIAMERSFPAGEGRDQVKERIRRIVSGCYQAARPGQRESPGEEDTQQDVLTQAIASMIEFDRKEKFDLNLLRQAKQIFANQSLGIPPGLRKHLWDSYFNDKNEKISEDILRVLSSLKKMTTQNGSKVIHLFQAWPGLKDLEDRAGFFQLTLTRILRRDCGDTSHHFTCLLMFFYIS